MKGLLCKQEDETGPQHSHEKVSGTAGRERCMKRTYRSLVLCKLIRVERERGREGREGERERERERMN